MITVYGRATSSNVQIVMWAIGELGLEYERLDYGHSYGKTKTPEYLAMNPNGLVPTVRDGDLVLWESGAVLRYLAARYGAEPFWPADPARRAPLDMWAEWAKTTFGPALFPIFQHLVRLPKAQRSEAALEAGVAGIAPVARILDARLGAGPWLAGEDFTFADIAAGTLLYRYYTFPFRRTETPNLDAYYERLKARPAYAEHAMVSYEPLRAPD